MEKGEQILRVALMTRVSTEEQVVRGYSLQAQEDALVKFANDNKMKIVGVYRDGGHSARKPVLQRPVMLDLLADVKAGKIDRILFTKLDRWFRNISEYYAIQDILDKNNVTWQAILEDYSTATADGRLKVNIMLSVAENEADRTSERIKFIFASKRENKEAFFSLPFGYKREMIDGVRRIVKDPETQPMVEYFFSRALETNIYQAAKDANSKFDLTIEYKTWHSYTRNELYTGSHRGIEGYAPPYISKEDLEVLINKNKVTKQRQFNRIYVFAGLITCPGCGRRLTGKYCVSTIGNESRYYCCNLKAVGLCDFTRVTEKKVEKYLLANLRGEIEKALLDAEEEQRAEKNSKSRKSEIENLQEMLRRINTAYFAGNMTDEEYATKTDDIKNQILAIKQKEVSGEKSLNIEALKAFLATDFENMYKDFTREEKRNMWQSMIDEIILEDKAPVSFKLKIQ